MSCSFGKGALEQRSIKTMQGRAFPGPELTHSGVEGQEFKDLFDTGLENNYVFELLRS